MSSFEVSVVWLCDGQTPDEAIAAHTVDYLQLDDDAPVLAPAPRGDRPDPSDEWDEFLHVPCKRCDPGFPMWTLWTRRRVPVTSASWSWQMSSGWSSP